jgi:uncharacterized protein (DUF1778 family)
MKQTKQQILRIAPATHGKAKAAAALRGKSLAEYVEETLLARAEKDIATPLTSADVPSAARPRRRRKIVGE